MALSPDGHHMKVFWEGLDRSSQSNVGSLLAGCGQPGRGLPNQTEMEIKAEKKAISFFPLNRTSSQFV